MNGILRRGVMDGVADIDLPREKLERLGVEALRDEELLAILLRTGYEGRNVLEISHAILQGCPIGTLMGLDMAGLTKLKGVGRAKAAALVAGFELSKRGLNQGMGIAASVTCPADGAAILSDIKDRRKEHFVAVFLNARNQVICREDVSVGSLNASLVQTREVRPIGHILDYPSA
jgi:DNA repair protein RadC